MKSKKITKFDKELYKTAKENDAELYKYLKGVYRNNGRAKDIEKEELEKLKKVVYGSQELQLRLRAYQKLNPYFDPAQRETAQKGIATLLYNLLDGDKKYFDKGEIIQVYLPKIGLGPIKMPEESRKPKDKEGGIEKWLFLIEDDKSASEILARYWEEQLLKQNPNPSSKDMEEFLEDKLKNGK